MGDRVQGHCRRGTLIVVVVVVGDVVGREGVIVWVVVAGRVGGGGWWRVSVGRLWGGAGIARQGEW